ncbi:MAG: DUF2461 domain-containing protein [Candidatus Marinimicrobia bacterium]|nr:DUF2461 domain-containing protein [Candidatus Neomarinimicrobiota bacterium]
MNEKFTGFKQETLHFYSKLSQNNNRDWFQSHQDIYRKFVLNPAQQFVIELGQRLASFSPEVVFDLRLNGSGSIFRINRDIRFSKDKSPYKTFLGILFWSNFGRKTGSPGYYFHLEPEGLFLYSGIHGFTKIQRDKFRSAVTDKTSGTELVHAVNQISKSGEYSIGGKNLKRFPPGYPNDQPSSEYLLFTGLHAGINTGIPKEFESSDLIDFCFRHFQAMSPIYDWLESNIF